MRKLKSLRKIDFLKWGQVLLILVVGFAPLLFASADLPQPPCGTLNGVRCGGERGVNDIIITVLNIIIGVAFIIAVLFLVIGGFRYITSSGNEESAEAGRKTIINALIGIVVIILSFVIVRVVSNTISNGGSGTTTP